MVCSLDQMDPLYAQPFSTSQGKVENNIQWVAVPVVPVLSCAMPSQFLQVEPAWTMPLQAGSTCFGQSSEFGNGSNWSAPVWSMAPCPSEPPSTPTASGQDWSEQHSSAGSEEGTWHPTFGVRPHSIKEALESGGQAQKDAIATLLQPGMLRNFAFDRDGCRVVQLAFDMVDRPTASSLAICLQGCIVNAIKHPHANYVVQKIISVLAFSEVPFLMQEIMDSEECVAIAFHEFGCRIFSRLLENWMGDARLADAMDHILWETFLLSRDRYGHHVVESALEHGLRRHKSQIVSALRKRLPQYAGNRNGAYVLEKAIRYGDQDHKDALARDMLSSPQVDLVDLASRNLGRSRGALVLALLEVSDEVHNALKDLLQTPEAQQCLANNKQSQLMRQVLSTL